LKAAPSQVVVVWQASQESDVTMCVPGLPVAVVPLWQVVQVPGATPVWLKLVGVHAVVRWQLSQEAVVRICPFGLPVAVVPLWQVVQVPGTTPV
jgi:hypothetical protein